MIAYAHINATDYERIKGVFDGIPHLVERRVLTDRLQLTDQILGPSERITLSDRVVIIRLEDATTVKDRLDDFGIRGVRWKQVLHSLRARGAPQWSEWAYLNQDGEIVYRLPQQRKSRRWKPTHPETANKTEGEDE